MTYSDSHQMAMSVLITDDFRLLHVSVCECVLVRVHVSMCLIPYFTHYSF